MVGEAEAFLCRVEDGGEGRVILAERLCRDEEIVVVGFDEPIAERGPEIERGKCRDEFEFREGARRRVDRRRFVDRRDRVGGFDVARDRPFRAGRRIVGGNFTTEREETPIRATRKAARRERFAIIRWFLLSLSIVADAGLVGLSTFLPRTKPPPSIAFYCDLAKMFKPTKRAIEESCRKPDPPAQNDSPHHASHIPRLVALNILPDANEKCNSGIVLCMGKMCSKRPNVLDGKNGR